MKTILSFLLAGILFLTGCCTKVGCVPLPLNYAEFTGFALPELDSAVLTVLENGVISEERVPTTENGGYESAYFNTVLKANSSYLIQTIPTGDTFRLEDIEMGREGCNQCFPVRPASDYYQVLKAYRVNGNRQENAAIRLNKS